MRCIEHDIKKRRSARRNRFAHTYLAPGLTLAEAEEEEEVVEEAVVVEEEEEVVVELELGQLQSQEDSDSSSEAQ
jgi:hypothetical protein